MDIPSSISKIGITKNIDKGTLLFQDGQSCSGFYYIVSGSLRVFSMDINGKEMEITRLSAGDFCGEAIAFAGKNFPVYAEIAEKAVLLYFSKTTIQAETTKHPEVAQFFLELLANKCITLNKRLETLSMSTVRQRLAKYLLQQCTGESCTITLGIKKGQLATELGTVNETLSRNFKHLEEDGLISVNGKKITIKNCQGLRAEL
jgi:CRP/FNR family transcriptional regulator